jgi:bacteriocin-like protein
MINIHQSKQSLKVDEKLHVRELTEKELEHVAGGTGRGGVATATNVSGSQSNTAVNTNL